MKHTKRPGHLLLLLLALAAPLALRAQDSAAKAIPDEDFYLMPAFSEGMIYLRGQGPAQGLINICAADQSLRYLDDSGTELSAADADAIVRVQIDTVWFLRSDGAFYRMYPLSSELGIALKKELKILRDVKKGAYGMADQTSSIRQYSTLYTDGAAVQLNRNQAADYTVSETVCLYCRDAVFRITKANLKKLFPEHKAEIDAYFKSGKPLPNSVDAARSLISAWL